MPRGGTSPGASEEDLRWWSARGRGQKLTKAEQLGIPQVAAERFEELLEAGEVPS